MLFRSSIEVAPEAGSLFARYARLLPEAVAGGIDWTRLGGATLADPAVTSLGGSLTFAQPATLAAGGTEWTLGGGAGGSVRVIPPGALFPDDVFGEDVAVESGERYVAVALRAEAGASAAGGAGMAGFAVSPGASFSLANYRRFAVEPLAPPAAAAVQSTLASLSLPRDCEDLKALPEGGIVALEGRGSLSIAGEANLLTAVNPLAAVELPGPLPELGIRGGGSLRVAANWTMAGEYKMRARKLAGNRVRLGFHRKRGTELEVSAKASAGLEVAAGERDLLGALLGAISGDPRAERSELLETGAPEARVAAIQGAVKAGIERKLEAALTAGLSTVASDGAAFLFEIELDRLEDAGRDAVERALGGDLSALAGAAAPAGVTALRNAFTSLRERTHTLKINLLGIYNAVSISRLALEGAVVYDPLTGDLAIADTAAAERIRASAVPFAADSARLRRVLAERFLITAAYRGSGAAQAAPTLKTSHSYFEMHKETDRRRMGEHLEAAAALGFLAAGEAGRLMGDERQFGRTSLYAEMRCDDGVAAALFLENGEPRPLEQYENAGREAILLLTPEGGPDGHRRLPAADGAFWARMKQAGPFNFKPLFPGLRDIEIQAIAADYTTIRWWADAMRGTAAKLAELRAFLAANPGIPWTDTRFGKLRQALAGHLREVARNTREQFGEPWGLVAMDRLLGGAAEARVDRKSVV